MKEHKPIPGALLILSFLILSAMAFFLFQYWNTSLRHDIINLQKVIHSLTNEGILAEIKLSQTSPEMMGQIIFYSPSGYPIQSEAFEMGGRDLFVEFRLMRWSYKTNQYVFGYPLRIYSDVVAPTNGIEVYTSFTNALASGKDIERLAYLLSRGDTLDSIVISHTQTIAVHQYPGKTWQNIHYLILYRQNNTVELREK